MTSENDQRREWFCREVLPLDRMLRAYAVRYCSAADDAQDLVHEAFAKLIVYEGWRSVDNAQAFATSTLRNLALTRLRRKKIVSMNVFADLDRLGLADEMPTADRILEAREEFHLIAGFIRELPEKCRRVFILRKICGFSHAEIAVKLDLSVSTVEKHVVKGLRLCAERMAALPAADQPVSSRRTKVREWKKSE